MSGASHMPDESFRRAEARPVIEEGAVAPKEGQEFLEHTPGLAGGVQAQ